ncbi:MAG: L-threonylcarbamoyladenylate synthase [Candidatus Baldrarchaeia archaeon]
MYKKIVVKTDPRSPDFKVIKMAVEILEEGGILIYPTETCYGLGVDALNEDAVKKVYIAKERPFSKPISIAVSDIEMAKKYAIFTPEAEILAKRFLPGPLTIALPKRKIVPDIVNPNAIAIRIPDHPVALAIIREFGRPITATSANKSGEPPPYSVRKAITSLKERYDLAIDVGRLRALKPSTIVDFTKEPSPLITRKGPIDPKEILRVLGIPEEEWDKHIMP